jgi:hypothetical protein
MASAINGAELQDMIRHWLNTPPNGYLGQDFGSDAMSLLQNPMRGGLADAFIGKMRKDIPLIGALPASAVDIYFREVPGSNDTKQLIIRVGDTQVTVDNIDASRIGQ